MGWMDVQVQQPVKYCKRAIAVSLRSVSNPSYRLRLSGCSTQDQMGEHDVVILAQGRGRIGERAMDWVNIALSVGGTLVVVGIAWGSEVSNRKQLEASLKKAEHVLERLEADRLANVSIIADLKARTDSHKNDIIELKQSKASIELVEGLREAIGRIDGKLDALLRRGPNQE